MNPGKMLLIAALATALPIAAQTTDTTSTMETKTTRTTTVKSTSRGKMSSSSKAKVWNDATRLEALLTDVSSAPSSVGAATWKTVGNEANSLANRIYASTGGSAAARDLRTQVRAMHTALTAGDAAGAKSAASAALPFAYKLVDWSTPAM